MPRHIMGLLSQKKSQLHPARFYEKFKYSYAQKTEAEREYVMMVCHFANYNDPRDYWTVICKYFHLMTRIEYE